MKKKTVSLVMSGVIAAGAVLGGCSFTSSSEKNIQPAAALGEETVDSGDYFPLKKTVDVAIAGVREDGFVPFDQCQMFLELEKATNLKVKWLDWPQSQQKEKRILRLQAVTFRMHFTEAGLWISRML